MDNKNILVLMLVGLVFGCLGYLIGNFFPIFVEKEDLDAENEEFREEESLVKLQVTVVDESEIPIPNLEVDVAESPGQPPEWGIAFTDEDGIAEYDIEPGGYVIYFNENGFPENFEFPEAQPVQVLNEGVTTQVVTLHPAK